MDFVEDNIVKPDSIDNVVTILYDKVKRNKNQVHEILPDWLVNATKIDDSFENSKKVSKIVEFNDEIKKLLKKSFKKLFPVQHSVIPAIINSNKYRKMFHPRDICVCAPTGSGKTLAYVTPILQLLKEDTTKVNGPRVLVVLPVRDLGLQVFNVFNGLSKSLDIKCALVTGQKNLADERKDILEGHGEQGTADVVVCTPGRLVDHIRNSKEIDWTYVRYLVIDEADRVLEEHKHEWYVTLTRTIDVSLRLTDVKRYKNILSCFVDNVRPHIQKILLSATLTREPHLLEHFDLHYPQLFVVGGQSNSKDSVAVKSGSDLADNYAAPKNLHDFYVVCSKEYIKILFIVDQVRRVKRTKILCFTNTRDSAARLNQLLQEFTGIRSEYLSCQLPPKRRAKLRREFERGQLDVLVTVDSMARGMDIEGVQCVVQYDIPVDVHTHIHRVGRTARGGHEGWAYALCGDKQVYHLKKAVAGCNRHVKQLKFSQGKCYKYMTEYNGALAKLQGAGGGSGATAHQDCADESGPCHQDMDTEPHTL